MAARASIGQDCHFCADITRTLHSCSESGYEFAALPLSNPQFRREFVGGKLKDRHERFTRADLILTSQDWSTIVVGKISAWLQVDSPHEVIRRNSELAFLQEFQYAMYLSLPAVMVTLTSGSCVNLGRLLFQKLLTGYTTQVWIKCPMKAPQINQVNFVEGLADLDLNASSCGDSWDWWHKLRSVCGSHRKLGLALVIPPDIPDPEDVDRWFGEPVRCAIVPTSIFLTNKKGFPVLSHAHQMLIQRLYRLEVQLMVSGSCHHGEKGLVSYRQYLTYLFETMPPLDTIAKFAIGYEDFLQCPLQPLMDNLESQTYEIFEKDPFKYSEYQRAIQLAIVDKISDEEKKTKSLVVMVVGAGRGPLVKAALAAAKSTDRRIHVFAVEKNPNAIVTLLHLKSEVWGDKVTVVSSDMREWEAPQKADILLSELLGSFGDNELSPECLDGAQRLLKEDGISIPESYTSYLSPLQSSKLYNEVRSSRDKDKHPEAHFEMPYVVKIHNHTLLAAPQPVFTFAHPNKDVVIDNSRYKILEFQISNNCTLHGFAGYFDCRLYKDSMLSIVPDRHSEGMFSWFPAFFPIKAPVYLSKGCMVELHIWRVVSAHKVWYEWCVTKPCITDIHNSGGRAYTIGL